LIGKGFSRHRSVRTMRITKAIRAQIFVILGIFTATVLTGVSGGFFTPNIDLRNYLLGLSSNLAVSIVIFLFLERGIKSLNPIGEIHKLPVPEIIEGIRNVRRGQRIRILDTFTILANDYPEFKDAVVAAVQKGAKIDILLLHPHSIGAERRAEQLKDQVDIIQEINKNLMYFYALQSELEDKYKRYVEVRLYSALPSISMYHCGEWAYVSLFPIEERGDESPNLKVPIDNPFGSYVDNTFEQIWRGTTKAPTILLEDHMRLRTEPIDGGSSHKGYYFAYQKVGGKIDRSQCFVLSDHDPFYGTVFKSPREVNDEIFFYVDGRKWRARPHMLDSRDPQGMSEYNNILSLIEKRYGWKEGKLGRNQEITCFKDIKGEDNS